MSTASLAWTAITNSFRSMSRTVLTVVAIFIGAFTLTLTTAVGNGINTYIDNTTSSIGGSSTLNVTKQSAENDDEPKKYTGAVVASNDQGPTGGTVEALTLRVVRLRAEDGTVWYLRNGEILKVGNLSQG